MHSGYVPLGANTKLEQYRRDVEAAYANTADRKIVWSNVDLGEEAVVMATFYNNGFGLRRSHTETSYITGIFLQASRLNHSCMPNCTYSWNKNLKHHRVHAVRDIAVGEELTISYVWILLDCAIRVKELMHGYGFVCDCPACEAEGNFGKASLRRRRYFYGLEAHLTASIESGIIGTCEQLMGTRVLELMEEEGITDWELGLA